MDKKTELREWLLKVRRYMNHDFNCSIWRETNPVCDCGLDAALLMAQRIVKLEHVNR